MSSERQPNTQAPLLLFDLDETLAPDEAVNDAVLAAIAEDVASLHGVRAEGLVAVLGRFAEALWLEGEAAAYCARIGISAREGLWGPFGPSTDASLAVLHASVPAYRARAWSTALAECGIQDAALAEALATYFAVERHARQAAYPWSRAVLEALRPRYRLGMITNGAPDLQRIKLAGTDLATWFDPLVVSGDLGVGKPEEAIFAHALERAGVAPEQAIMIGDSWQRDVVGAVEAGLRAIWVNPHGAPPPLLPAGAPRVPVAADLRALPAILSELEPSIED